MTAKTIMNNDPFDDYLENNDDELEFDDDEEDLFIDDKIFDDNSPISNDWDDDNDY